MRNWQLVGSILKLEYVKAWARDLVVAVGNREARRILDDYKVISGDKRLAKADRDIAARRVRILACDNPPCPLVHHPHPGGGCGV